MRKRGECGVKKTQVERGQRRIYLKSRRKTRFRVFSAGPSEDGYQDVEMRSEEKYT